MPYWTTGPGDEFKKRAAEIRENIEAAEAIGDDDRSGTLAEELEALTSSPGPMA